MTMTISALRKLATQKTADGHLSAADAKALIKAAGTTASATRNLTKILDQFAAVCTGAGKAELQKAIGGTAPAGGSKISPATHNALLRTFTSVRDNLGEGFASMPLGHRFVREPLYADKHPDGFSYAAMVPAGVLGMCNPPTDPNKATTCYIERTGGIAGLKRYFGPFDIVRTAPSKDVVIDGDDSGKTFEVKKGQDVVVDLVKAGGSGYSWFVTGTDRTFGHPATDENKIKFQGPSMCGGPVHQILTWKTSQSYIREGGTHRVELELKRGHDGEPARTFEFTVKIV